MTNGEPRMLVIANKAWEADPLTYALGAAPSAVPETYRPRPDAVAFARSAGTAGLRGLVAAPGVRVEVWCLEELIPTGLAKSNSALKAEALAPLLADPSVALVVAFGTAASSPASETCANGCVVVGTNAFVHDFKSPKTSPLWVPPHPDRLMASSLDDARFGAIMSTGAYRTSVESSRCPRR